MHWFISYLVVLPPSLLRLMGAIKCLNALHLPSLAICASKCPHLFACNKIKHVCYTCMPTNIFTASTLPSLFVYATKINMHHSIRMQIDVRLESLLGTHK